MQMVNTWFPGIAPYGFEMVDGAAQRERSNRKFTANPFHRFFCKFSAN